MSRLLHLIASEGGERTLGFLGLLVQELRGSQGDMIVARTAVSRLQSIVGTGDTNQDLEMVCDRLFGWARYLMPTEATLV